MKNLITLWNIIRPYRVIAIALIFIMVAGAFTDMLSMGMILPILNYITSPHNIRPGYMKYLSSITRYFPESHDFFIILCLFAALIIGKNILAMLRVVFRTRLGEGMREYWVGRIMRNYMYATYPYILSQKQGVLLNNMLREPLKGMKGLEFIIEFCAQSILVMFLYCILLFVNYKITLALTLIAAVMLIILGKGSSVYSLGVGVKKMKLEQELRALATEYMMGIRQIKVSLLENKVCERFLAVLRSLMRVIVRFAIVSQLPELITESLVVIGTCSVLVWFYYFSKISMISVIPVLGFFIVVSQRLFPAASRLFSIRMELLSFVHSLKLVHDLSNTRIEREDLDKGVSIDSLDADIKFEDVSFLYNEKAPLFRDLNLTIPRKKIVAIVGASGAGKSTLLDLLFGFIKPQKGRILLNGVDISEVKLRSWRKLVGYVSQDTFLFNASIKENILAGNIGASKKDMINAAKEANADEFIRELPDGYDTILGDRGLRISGGQRQRIAIARALMHNPDLLIFDEATSNLDTESEKKIREAIYNLAGHKTIIIISHRLATVKDADIINVLHKGSVVESGTHDQLMDKKGYFYRFQTGEMMQGQEELQ